jgi:photosystem II stability/assembly factor-like uncharacterized protein
MRSLAAGGVLALLVWSIACGGDQPGRARSGGEKPPADARATMVLRGIEIVDAATMYTWGVDDEETLSVVLKSTDGGTTWTPVLRVDVDLVGLDFEGPSGVAISDEGEIFTTEDGAASWRARPDAAFKLRHAMQAPNLKGKGRISFEFNACTVIGRITWVVGSRGEVTGKGASMEATTIPLLVSSSDGKTWKVANLPSPPEMPANAVRFFDGEHGWVLLEPPDDETPGALLRTTDGGDSWVQASTGVAQSPTDVAFVDANNGWLVGLAGGQNDEPSQILATVDGGVTWRPQAKVPVALFGIAFLDATNGWAVGAGAHIFHTNDGGLSWTDLSSVDVAGGRLLEAAPPARIEDFDNESFTAFALAPGGRGWAVTDAGGIFSYGGD